MSRAVRAWSSVAPHFIAREYGRIGGRSSDTDENCSLTRCHPIKKDEHSVRQFTLSCSAYQPHSDEGSGLNAKTFRGLTVTQRLF